jgi:hypothetical protein
MAGPYDTHCLYSTVRNVSGGRKIFGFLPPHGRELANNEEFTLFGNILDAVAHFNGGDRTTSRRHVDAFAQAVSRGDLIVVHTPNPILEDATTHAVKMIRLNGGALGVVDPCWTLPGSVVSDVSGGNPFDG